MNNGRRGQTFDFRLGHALVAHAHALNAQAGGAPHEAIWALLGAGISNFLSEYGNDVTADVLEGILFSLHEGPGEGANVVNFSEARNKKNGG